MTSTIRVLLCLILGLIVSNSVGAAGSRVAILGDSITYDGRWVTKVESALRGTPEFANGDIVNFGLGSETVSGLSEKGHAGGKFPRPCLFERLDRILETYKPDLVLACYGMNDGIYLPLDEARFKAYRDGIERLKSDVEKQGGEVVFITPPLHDADNPSDDPNRYDAVLDAYGEWLVSRRADGWQVIDIRPHSKKKVAALKSGNPKFIYAKDKVHPGFGGHDMIARSICNQLWPILKLSGQPQIEQGDALRILARRNELLKLAWLTRTGHKRPGVPEGLPLHQAEPRAQQLLRDYHADLTKGFTSWNGFERRNFGVANRAALLVSPKTPAPGKPWIWRSEFFGHEPQADIALLGKGFHLAYIDVVEKRYLELGGKIRVIRKPGGKHHPHSLPDPAPIVEFVTGCHP